MKTPPMTTRPEDVPECLPPDADIVDRLREHGLIELDEAADAIDQCRAVILRLVDMNKSLVHLPDVKAALGKDA